MNVSRSMVAETDKPSTMFGTQMSAAIRSIPELVHLRSRIHTQFFCDIILPSNLICVCVLLKDAVVVSVTYGDEYGVLVELY